MSKGVCLLSGNTPARKSKVAISKAVSCGFQLLPLPPYSPNLAPPDHLFHNVTKQLRGRVFFYNDQAMAAVLNVLDGLQPISSRRA